MATANGQLGMPQPSPLPEGERGADIERIVREVVRRLRDLGVVQTNGQALPQKPKSSSDLIIEERLVTLETLHNRLAGVKTVIVPPRAIVTPAVVDELKDRDVALTRTGAASDQADQKDAHAPEALLPFVVVATDGIDVDSLRRLCGPGIAISSSNASADWLTVVSQRIENGTVAVVITGAPAAAVVKANRDPNIRAAVGFNFPAVRQAVDEVNANLLAIDPREKNTTQLFGLINEFCNRS